MNSTTTTGSCWCGRDAVLFAVGGDQPPRQWCEEHQPDDPYDLDAAYLPYLDAEPEPAPPPAVAPARGLLWLAELARDLHVEVAGLEWARRGAWSVHVGRAGDVDVLADALGLPAETTLHGGKCCRVASREGDAWDMRVKVYGPAAEVRVSCGADR